MKRRSHFITMNHDEEISKKVALVERNFIPDGVPLVNTVAVARKSPGDLVELAMEIQKADDFVKATACSKLQIIAEQVRFLQSQAQQVLKEAKLNTELHHAACNFKKVPGTTYYLYRRASGQVYFSMLSAEEWKDHPHEYLGAYRLEADQSWTPESQISQRDSQNELLDKILSANDQVPLMHALENTKMEFS